MTDGGIEFKFRYWVTYQPTPWSITMTLDNGDEVRFVPSAIDDAAEESDE